MAALLHFVALLVIALTHVTQGRETCSRLTRSSSGHSEVTYQSSDASVINPEAGGAWQINSYASNPRPLKFDQLSRLRTDHKINIVWRQWYLDTFLTKSISSGFLSDIEEDFKMLRRAGFKATLRFAYTSDQNARTTEPKLSLMLKHIKQLKSLLQSHSDVIMSVQMGFIGVWGEWYYTTHFGNKGKVSDAQWKMRRQVVDALLDAVPEHISLHIRTPALKRKITQMNGALHSGDYKDSNNKASRIGHHNDCFLASATDFGTYGNIKVDYPYLKQDTKYVPMGGETCAKDPPRSECKTAKKELAMFHWTFMNLAYNMDVLKSWKTGGCYDEIMDHLGYRLSLVNAILPDDVSSGADACFQIIFKNKGYAAPINAHHVRLYLRGSGKVYSSEHISKFTEAEPWLPESGEITITFSLKVNVPVGRYEVLLMIGNTILEGNVDYNILLLNNGVPELNVGMNNLGHSIQVTKSTVKGSSDGFTIKPSGLPTSASLRCYANCKGYK